MATKALIIVKSSVPVTISSAIDAVDRFTRLETKNIQRHKANESFDSSSSSSSNINKVVAAVLSDEIVEKLVSIREMMGEEGTASLTLGDSSGNSKDESSVSKAKTSSVKKEAC